MALFESKKGRSAMKPSKLQNYADDVTTNFLKQTVNAVDKYGGGVGTRQLLGHLGQAKDRVAQDVTNTQRTVKAASGTTNVQNEDILPSGRAFKKTRLSEFGNATPENLAQKQVNDTLIEAGKRDDGLANQGSADRARADANLAYSNTNGLLPGLQEDRSPGGLPGSQQIGGYSVTPGGASQGELARFAAGGGGNRSIAGGRGPRTSQKSGGIQSPYGPGGINSRRGQSQGDDQQAKLWEIANNSPFKHRRQTAMKGLQMLQSGQQADANRAVNQEQFGATFGEGQRQFDLREGRLGAQTDLANRIAGSRLGIEQQRANTNANYTQGLLKNQTVKDGLTEKDALDAKMSASKMYNKATEMNPGMSVDSWLMNNPQHMQDIYGSKPKYNKKQAEDIINRGNYKEQYDSYDENRQAEIVRKIMYGEADE